jgi:hypothetical protein
VFEELAVQAGATVVEKSGWTDYGTLDLDVEKFAELIVRECSKVIVNGGYRNPTLGEKHPLTPPEIAKMIEEYFGVEE